MCGIFGLVSAKKSGLKPKEIKNVMDRLFQLSESRGKEASGLAFWHQDEIKVYKKPIAASQLIKTGEYRNLFAEINQDFPWAFVGHARLVTNGSMADNNNNQPVRKQGIVGVHNGIIVNDAEIWRDFPALQRESQVDTEAMLALVRLFLARGESLPAAVGKTFQIIKGSASAALFFQDIRVLLLATNTGSLYVGRHRDNGLLIFASEKYILETLVGKRSLKKIFFAMDIFQVKAGTGYLLDLDSLAAKIFSLSEPEPAAGNSATADHWVNKAAALKIIELCPSQLGENIKENIFSFFAVGLEKFDPDFAAIRAIRRCRQCILPATMPFIEFDEKGVCNYCRHYEKMKTRGEAELAAAVAPLKNQSGQADCLVALSGGRDSCYALHYAKNVLRLNPVAYSYDWGMITDLGRRNQARLCGQLGVEQILVSADIRKKRENIRKNVAAWLKKPDLGTIPLFMAGDKQYFYHLNRLKKQLRVDLIVYAENPLEKTSFKFGFCGVKPYFDSRRGYDFDFSRKMKLLFYYGKQYLSNPSYLNSSLIDTIGAYLSSYFVAHDYLYLFNYLRWEEEKIVSTLLKEYNWELAPDTETTWRIGDGTAAFYNYIYGSLAGLTENDTFRSNQIREGMIFREAALALAARDNRPRYESIKWYCDTVGLDFENTLKTISAAGKLYSR